MLDTFSWVTFAVLMTVLVNCTERERERRKIHTPEAIENKIYRSDKSYDWNSKSITDEISLSGCERASSSCRFRFFTRPWMFPISLGPRWLIRLQRSSQKNGIFLFRRYSSSLPSIWNRSMSWWLFVSDLVIKRFEGLTVVTMKLTYLPV